LQRPTDEHQGPIIQIGMANLDVSGETLTFEAEDHLGTSDRDGEPGRQQKNVNSRLERNQKLRRIIRGLIHVAEYEGEEHAWQILLCGPVTRRTDVGLGPESRGD
jgi:hypothetical protein